MDNIEWKIRLNEWREISNIEKEQHKLFLLAELLDFTGDLFLDMKRQIRLLQNDAPDFYRLSLDVSLTGESYIRRKPYSGSKFFFGCVDWTEILHTLHHKNPACAAFRISPTSMKMWNTRSQ